MFVALALTIVIEGLVMYFLTKSPEWVKYNLYCNLVTNPLLNLALLGTGFLFGNLEKPVIRALMTYYIPMVLLEALVFWGEGRLYMLLTNSPKKQCFRRSVITNAVSASVGIAFSFIYFFVWAL